MIIIHMSSIKIKYYLWFIIIIIIIMNLDSVIASSCTPSTCGKIGNISFPFRLRSDPKHCGNHDYELLCENNNTTLSLFLRSHKYTVHSINYSNFTIRLSDASIDSNDSCSFPNHSLSPADFPDHGYPYGTQLYRSSRPFYWELFSGRRRGNQSLTETITFMSCPSPANHSQQLLEITTACVGVDVDSNDTIHRYIKLGGLNATYWMEMCKIEMMTMTSSSSPLNPLGEKEGKGKSDDVVSLSEIHSSLLYGFELSWFIALCDRHCDDCWLVDGKKTQCRYSSCSIGGWDIPCGGMPYWFGFALSVISLIIKLLIEVGLLVNLALRIIIGIPCVAVFLICKHRRRRFSAFSKIEGFLQNNNNLVPIRYSYSEIKKMTRKFREELGKGGYGSVYKGKLRSGNEVAVKMLSKTKDNGQDFINEVSTIGRIHHVNIVKLVGYCVERSKRALVYDLMPNGSLEKYIFDKQRPDSLSWERKYDIAIGVARGIEYLHKGCDVQILHFDIKPHNILLDENFTPKISDFGLAKFFSVEKNAVTLTAARGTIGYVAPELINRGIGEVSYKADVYSFGMLLMEMVGVNRGKARDGDHDCSSQYFPNWIYDRINKGKKIDTGNVADDDDECARKFIHQMTVVGLWCIQMNPISRPSMGEVLKMLEGRNENLQIPPQPDQLCESSQNDHCYIGISTSEEIWEIDQSSESMAILGRDALSIEHG